ncbi:hypothetical protein CYMTET_43186 [Cymbomonas tetramitiformis]|uniref:Uncharacterized protein n=1 Tax=Cymbomonas tetramitiformis TaxID=36881 RepID=A0AAE0F0T5_9CHLO|nr:hypothetical protein CYMTET_43186 [Cymbomonas tetramitiformis]
MVEEMYANIQKAPASTKEAQAVPGATSRRLRKQVVLNEDGSVRWKIVPEDTPEVPSMHESDERCTMGSWPYIVVGHDMGLRRWVRRRPGGWALEDATKPLEVLPPFDLEVVDRTLAPWPSPVPSPVPSDDGKVGGELEGSEVAAGDLNTTTEASKEGDDTPSDKVKLEESDGSQAPMTVVDLSSSEEEKDLAPRILEQVSSLLESYLKPDDFKKYEFISVDHPDIKKSIELPTTIYTLLSNGVNGDLT